MTPIDTKLYELFADKTLSEGCIFKWDAKTKKYSGYWKINGVTKKGEYPSSRLDGELIDDVNIFPAVTILSGILGHEPQLHDVFRVSLGMPYGDRIELQSRGKQFYLMVDRDIALRTESINIPYNPTLSLIAQSDECKQAIVELFSN